MGPLRRNASGGVRSCSSGNGSGRTRPRRGLRWWFMRCPPSGPAAVAAVVLALGTGLMHQDYLRRPPNSRTGQVRASVRPAASRRPGRNRPVSPIGHNPSARRGQGVGETARLPGPAPCPTPTVMVAGSGAGVSGCCGGGATSLGETTVYSPSSKSPLRPYARCPMQRTMFLTFVVGGLVNPAIDVARGWP